MAFITKCPQITKKEAEALLTNFNYSSLDSERFKQVKVAGKPLISEKRNFIKGTILVKSRYMDWDYEVEDNYIPVLTENPIFLKDELDFIIFPELNIIAFDSKDKSKIYGLNILNKVLFSRGNGQIRPVHFKPQSVLEAKDKGEFDNVWFNGVREDGNIKYQAQYGEEIDEDLQFLGDASNREGIGVEVLSKTGKRVKVMAFKSGSLLKHIKLKNSDEEVVLLKELIGIFLPHSDYGTRTETQTQLPDELVELEDFFIQ